MTEPLTYLITYLNEPADRVAALACILPMLIVTIGVAITLYLDLIRNKAMDKFGVAAVMKATPNWAERQATAFIVLGSVTLLLGIYVAFWYYDHVEDSLFHSFIDWGFPIWKSVY